MYQKIMVAVDGSASSKRALNEALKIAKLTNGHIYAVYVVDKSVLLNYPDQYDPNALLDAFRQTGRSALAEAKHAITAAGMEGDTEFIETEGIVDEVADCLKRYAQHVGVDLAVMGTHGRRGVRRVILGSVSERFLRTSNCPVLLVRADNVPEDAASQA